MDLNQLHFFINKLYNYLEFTEGINKKKLKFKIILTEFGCQFSFRK